MQAQKTKESQDKMEAMEFADLVKTMSKEEKQQVKGIMIGFRLADQNLMQREKVTH